MCARAVRRVYLCSFLIIILISAIHRSARSQKLQQQQHTSRLSLSLSRPLVARPDRSPFPRGFSSVFAPRRRFNNSNFVFSRTDYSHLYVFCFLQSRSYKLTYDYSLITVFYVRIFKRPVFLFFSLITDFAMAKILVVGGGGREHAIAWKLSLSPKVRIFICIYIRVYIRVVHIYVCLNFF